MSARSGSGSEEGSGDEIRPHGEEHDSSEESEDDIEEAKRIAEGFIVDEEEDDDEEAGEEDEETRKRRRRDKKRRRKREARAARRDRDHAELSEDELELLNENRGLGGPSTSRPLKRLRRRSGSGATDEGEGGPALKDMFADDEGRFEDEDESDMGDFIEEDEEEAPTGETEDQRRERRREEKIKRREAARTRPDLAGVDRGTWDAIVDVFGGGNDYDWALEGEEGLEEEEEPKEIRLEDVFDPSEIKERRLGDEDRAIANSDRPERHQLVNSTLSDNPIPAPDMLFPPPELASGWAYNKISIRTGYIFCGMGEEGTYPEPSFLDPNPLPAVRRPDLVQEYISAVARALDMMFVQNLEVPYLWHYKRDAFSKLENQGQSSVQFLERDELWMLYNLGTRFRAIYERTEQMKDTWRKIKERKPEIEDAYLIQTLLPSVCMMSVEAAAEGNEWLGYHYAEDIRRIKEDEAIEEGKKRLPERLGQEDLRSGPILKLVEAFGVSVPQVAVTFNDPQGTPTAPKNPDKLPTDVAEEYAGPSTPFLTGEDALKAASHILTLDFSKDPSIRQQAREFIEACGVVSVTPTERGMTVIDQYHLYYTFKFLTRKPVSDFKDSPQFLHMLKAEDEGLVNISIDVQDDMSKQFIDTLVRCVHSNDYGEVSTAWNAVREQVCDDVVKKYLIPSGARWAREHLRGQAEEYVAERCRIELEFRVNVRPFATPRMEQGETPSVLALTNGKGDARDAIIAVMLDDEGNIRAQTKFDNLRDQADRDSFLELVERRKPKVVVVGGLSVHAGKLRDEAAAVLRELAIRQSGEHPPVSESYSNHDDFVAATGDFDARVVQPRVVPVIFAADATARMYMLSEEAAREHPTLPVNGRYALALARYTQNPLNAYAKLGKSVTEITFMEHHQKLISQEKLLLHLERGLVNAVCFMGIEVNSCVADPYQRAMLPFIAGLGPRKANALINGVQRLGALTNRMQFSDAGLFGPTVFENVAGFLCIEHDLKDMLLEENNPQEQPDPLDMTRIHPEDYEFAQKMCQDALDLDVEDVEGQHKSDVVQKLMLMDDRARMLSELNLDDFAYNLQRQGEGNKRHTLGEIVNELISYRADRRPGFYIPSDWEVVAMLTGETERTIGRGMKVTATVRKVLASRAFCQLESGMDAILERDYAGDDNNPVSSLEDVLQSRQAIQAVVIMPEPARFQVRISIRPGDLAQAVTFLQPFRDEKYNDVARQVAAEEAATQRKRRAAGTMKRQINHPNWHIMNSGQAEQFLASQHRGDVVVRPSSKGPDHIAVTWKVDEDVYQHIDVQELDKGPGDSIGRILRIANRYSYSDIDELIINHVKAMARKVDEMVVHEKYRPEHELEAYLKNYVQAHPGRSMYGFSIDSDRPGFLKLCFLNKSTKDGGVIQTWPVKILPGAYQLNNAEVPGVTELCNAFKAQYSSRLAEQGSGGKTPGIRAGKTPLGGRTPGGRTPGMPLGGTTPLGGAMGRTPVRPGMTPNPYGAPPQQTPVNAFGNATPYGGGGGYPNGAQGGYPQQPPRPPYGTQGPGMGMPPMPTQGYAAPPGGYGMGAGAPGMPPQMPMGMGMGGPEPPNGQGGPPRPPQGGMGMNPERAAMLARQGGQGY